MAGKPQQRIYPITAGPEYKRKWDEKKEGKKLSIYLQQVILEFSGRSVLHFKQIDLKVLGLFGSQEISKLAN